MFAMTLGRLLVAASIATTALGCGLAGDPKPDPQASPVDEPEPKPEPEPDPEPEPQSVVACALEGTVPTGAPIEVEASGEDDATIEAELLEQLCTNAGRPGCSVDEFRQVSTSTSLTIINGVHSRTRKVTYRAARTVEGKAEAPHRATACGQAWSELCRTAGLTPHRDCPRQVTLTHVDGTDAADLIGGIPDSVPDDRWPVGSPPHTCHLELEVDGRASTTKGASTQSWAQACGRAVLRWCGDREPCIWPAGAKLDGIPRVAFLRGRGLDR